jgi:hypothetical protein
MFGKVHLSLVHLLERGGEDKRRKATKTSLCLIVQSPKQLIMALVCESFSSYVLLPPFWFYYRPLTQN